MARTAHPTCPQGERLALIIAQQKLRTLTALGAASGVTVTRLSQAKSGARPLGTIICERVARRFGYRPAWLLTGEGPSRPHQPGGPEWRQAQAARLEIVYQETGLKAREMAPLLGLTEKTLAGAHSGRTGIGPRLAAALQRQFGYRVEWLRHGEGTPMDLATERPAERARLEREATVAAAAFDLVERHAPAYLTDQERLVLANQLATRVLHPRSFLPLAAIPPKNQRVKKAKGVTETAP